MTLTEELKEQINSWNDGLKGESPEKVIAFFLDIFKNRIALSTSLGAEDQVLTRMVSESDHEAWIFTLDTGRLFPETYDLISLTNRKYKTKKSVKLMC